MNVKQKRRAPVAQTGVLLYKFGVDLSQQIKQARQFHASGNLAQAEGIYGQILSVEPNHAEAIHYSGMIAFQRRKFAEALQLLERSVQLAPQVGPFLQNLAYVYQWVEQFDQAAEALRRAILLEPANIGLLIRHAFVLNRLGKLDDARQQLLQGLQISPNHSDVIANLGVIEAQMNLHEQAVARFRSAIAQAGEQAPMFINLGLSLNALARHEEALAAYDRAIQLSPQLAEAHEYRGLVLASMRRLDEAIESHTRAVELSPRSAPAWNNLGTALQKKGKAASAIAAFNRAIELNPDYAEAHNNRATSLIDHGDVATALSSYRRAIELVPDTPELRRNYALALLANRDYENGWREWEWRLKCANWDSRRAILSRPRWDGSPLTNQILLIHAEQGFGDTIQFARFLTLAIARCQNIILHCQSGLETLLADSFPQIRVVRSGTQSPQFDFQVPLMSLAGIFQVRAETIPNSVPYLSCPAERRDRWRQELAGPKEIYKVGLVWAGSGVDPHRKLKLDDFLAINDLPNVQLFSLQPDVVPESQVRIRDLSKGLTNFAETAAVIENLDLIISIDTAVAHLAGALGKRTWALLRFAPDWRWSLARDTTPWYPTMRLFRQPEIGDWQSVVRDVVDALRLLIKREPE